MHLPLRPILIVRQDSTNSPATVEDTNDTNQATSPTKAKKRVVFADSKGLALAHVKIMSEPSDCPPHWQDEFLEQVTRGATASVVPDAWEPAFPQPASDYMEFRNRLEKNCVCLENVIIRDTEETILGTIKVKNICFHKQVFVRVTYDEWTSFTDIMAIFVPSGTEGTAVYDLYDTFSFTLAITPQATKRKSVQFCVCFKCDKGEFWDNNSGKNYKIVCVGSSSPTELNMKPSNQTRFEDAFTARFEHWTEFASWNHLVNDAPYW